MPRRCARRRFPSSRRAAPCRRKSGRELSPNPAEGIRSDEIKNSEAYRRIGGIASDRMSTSFGNTRPVNRLHQQKTWGVSMLKIVLLTAALSAAQTTAFAFETRDTKVEAFVATRGVNF